MTKEKAIEYIIPAIKKMWNDEKCNEIIKALVKEESEEKNENRNN